MARLAVKPAKPYPGQCIHAWWAGLQEGTERCAHGCESTCRRGADGKIESYTAGKKLLTTPVSLLNPRRAGRRFGGAR